MENWLEKVYERINEKFEAEHLTKILSLVRQPSIAGTGEGIEKCANMVLDMLNDIGCVDGHLEHYVHSPVVSAKLMSEKPGAPTLVVYGMYDVQPPEPLEEWKVPPYDGAIIDFPPYGECVVSRGIANSKGPLVCFFNTVKTIKEELGYFPLNLWFVIEGEEEMGSESLIPFTAKHANELNKCLGVYLLSARQDENGKPFTTLGNKGILYFEMEAKGAEWGGPSKLDIHGSNAAWISNPIWRLVNALGTMRDNDDNILIDGFYDEVASLDEMDEYYTERMAEVLDEDMYLNKRFYATRFIHGKPGRDALRDLLWKPTLNIDGIWGGYIGPATKTIVPYHATCKVDVRLVPNMRPERTLELIRKHLDRHGYSDIILTRRQGTPYSKVNADSSLAKACISAMEMSGYPENTVWPIFPGSGPAYLFTDPPVNLPLVDYSLGIHGQIHAPNEYFTVKGLRENELSVAAVLWNLCRVIEEEGVKK